LVGGLFPGSALLPGQTLIWRLLTTTPDAVAMAYDVRTSNLVMVGADGSSTKMWEWDGSSVRVRSDDLGPSAEVQALFADPAGNQVLAWSPTRQRIGTWRGGPWQWAAAPSATDFSGASAAFDARRRRLVVLPSLGNGDIFEWDGVQWWPVVAAGGPGARSGVASAYDPVRQGVVFYGGVVAGTAMDDAYAFDGSAWTALGSGLPPGPRRGAVMAHDPQRNQLVLYGGSAATSTWTLRGNLWTAVATTRDPGLRVGARLAWDGQGLLLAGGDGDGEAPGWRFDGVDWHLLGSFGVPRRGPGEFVVVRDRGRGQWVGFGGEGAALAGNATVLFDTQWRAARPATQPSPRNGAQMAWSQVDNAVLLWGGVDAAGPSTETWLWNGTNWSLRPVTQAPAPRLYHRLCEDPAGRVSLFGGVLPPSASLQEHWQWDGAGWTMLPLPPQMLSFGYNSNARFGRDEVRNRLVVMFPAAGIVPAQVWEWDGVAWSQRATSVPNMILTSPGLPFVPQAGGLVYVGLPMSQLWTGSGWVPYSMPSNGEPMLLEPSGSRLMSWRLRNRAVTTSVLTRTPAAASAVGTGCAVGVLPDLGCVQEPWLGTADFALVVSTQAGAAPTWMVAGFGTRLQTLGAGCALYVDQQISSWLAVASNSGELRTPLPIPNHPSFLGVGFYAQAAVLDPPRSPLGVATWTQALQVQCGN
jgi:hypothetical protein